MLGWIGLVAAVGVPLDLYGVISLSGQLVQNLVGLIVIAPIVGAVAWWESRQRAATIGKRALHLVVEHNGARPGFARALLRNILKLGAPWLIAHAAVFAMVDSSAPGQTSTRATSLLICSYVLPILWLVTFLLPGGRALYDRLSSTQVRNVENGRRSGR